MREGTEGSRRCIDGRVRQRLDWEIQYIPSEPFQAAGFTKASWGSRGRWGGDRGDAVHRSVTWGRGVWWKRFLPAGLMRLEGLPPAPHLSHLGKENEHKCLQVNVWLIPPGPKEKDGFPNHSGFVLSSHLWPQAALWVWVTDVPSQDLNWL